MKALREAGPEAGGKAGVLARLLNAGLRVPAGFCAFPQDSDQQVIEAWRAMGEPPVAVRSSGSAEDGANQSFAGQFETVLDVTGPQQLVAALARTRASLEAPQSYLGTEAAVGGCVIVQAMIEASVAGVLFTLDPTASGPCLRLEAHPGRGDALVSGQVRPSTWRLEGDSLRLVEGPPCLEEAQVGAVVEASRRIQAVLGGELDIEFAFEKSSGDLWILQARPITVVKGDAQIARQRVRQEEIDKARALSHPGGTVWSRYSLAETLPSPLPMTWSIVRRMLSGRGAFGRLYRDLGFDPHPSIDDEGVLDLICGRPYYNLSREVRLYFGDFPFVHPIEAIRSDPRRASYPSPQIDLSQAPPGFWSRLPGTLWKMLRAHFRSEGLKKTFAARLTKEIGPAFLARISQLSQENLEALEVEALVERLHKLVVLVVDEFAADSLKASAFAALSIAALERQHGAAQTARLVGGVRPAPDCDLAGLLSRAAAGQISFDQLLSAIGHRGIAEMELAEPRWREVPLRLREEVQKMGARATPGPTQDETLAAAHPWLSLRETARHWLMHGWAEIRRTLLALDQKLDLQGGIFWLGLSELPQAASSLIAERRQRHRLLATLPCPAVLFSDDLEAIGRTPAPIDTSSGFTGTALSWGVVDGPALVVDHVGQVPQGASDYILVCPTTDPGYTFAMTRARGLVVETGGVLSHGAIVARELGLPAVSNIPIGALKTGMRVRVDGEQGRVWVIDQVDS